MSRGLGRREGDPWRRSGYGAGRLWSPTDLPGLALWLRADMGITLAGAKVSAWADQSNNGRDFAQGTDARRPTFTASAASFSGQPCVSFAAAHILSSLAPLPAFAGGVTVAIAIGDTPAQGTVLLEQGSGALSDTFGLYLDAAPRYRGLYQKPAGGFFTQFATGAPPTASSWITTVDPAAAAASQVRCYLDDVLGSSVSTAAASGTIVSDTWHLGARTPLTAPFTGNLAEVIVYDRVISSGERAAVYAYQRQRFG